jgi:hypothetical protein
MEKFVSLQRGIQEILGVKDQWTRESIPMTTGSMVAHTFEQWVYRQHGEYEDLFKFCTRKLGILAPDKPKRYEKGLRLLNKYYSAFPDGLAMHNRRKHDEVWWLLKHARFRHTALDGGSIKWFASLDANETAIFNAVVQGGRCNNEIPEEYLAEYGLDIDISGCYGAALRSFTFPVGLPTIWSYSLNQNNKPTLGEWLRQNRDELVPGLWQVVVRGGLSFPQDLVYSRDVDAADIRKAVQSRWLRDKDDDDITSKTMLLRHQILNGVVTSDILEVLLKTATERERKEIMSLRVWTAAAYLKSDRCDGLMSWANKVVPDTGRHANETGQTVEDNRARAWLAVPLEEYIGRMCDERASLKAKKKQEDLSPEEKARLMGLDEIFKVNINTVYGTLASRFFAVGNSILANNITARGRVGVWMLAKALRLRQTITDGGIYEPSSVAWWKGPKPGLATLADMYEWKMKCRRGFTSLAGLDWKAAITNQALPEDLDALALAHVKEFWVPYGLEFPFGKVEHKKENTFIRAAYLFKADYGLDRAGFHDPKYPARLFCLRGKDRDARAKGNKQHPSFTWLGNILDGSNAFPDDLTHTKGGILTIKQWVQNQCQDVGEELKALRPGDSLPERTFTQRYNNVHTRLADYDDWKGRYDRKKVVRGKPNRWFERYGAAGTRAVHKAMLANRRLGDDIV